ncbi:uncharacterized protein LOC135817552 [Sycon ciliatum]|uniref:uncharacterized protein LOC135817552 n=1 Tax=Sycon ciliatum TaxID=27933 RepID=UPI0020AB9DD5|eukprot:scpid50744/ scgid10666/ 
MAAASPNAKSIPQTAPREIPAQPRTPANRLRDPCSKSPKSLSSPRSFSYEDDKNWFSRSHTSSSPSNAPRLHASDLECFHVGQVWTDTGIALVGDGDFSIRLHCQRRQVPAGTSREDADLVICVGSGGTCRPLSEGSCIIGLTYRRHSTKKGKAFLVPEFCTCIVRDPKPVLISCGVATLRKCTDGTSQIVLKRGSNSQALVSVKTKLYSVLNSLARGQQKHSVDEIIRGLNMWTDYELDSLADMSATSMRCLFYNSSSKQQHYKESWNSLFANQPPSNAILRQLQECAEEEAARRRSLPPGTVIEDLTRPWTLPKGNFCHPGQGEFEKPWECAARELKAETGMEWTACRADAPFVDILRPNSLVSMERFFIWRDDSLPAVQEKNESGGEKQWKWFNLADAAHKSETAKTIIGSAQCQDLLKREL